MKKDNMKQVVKMFYDDQIRNVSVPPPPNLQGFSKGTQGKSLLSSILKVAISYSLLLGFLGYGLLTPGPAARLLEENLNSSVYLEAGQLIKEGARYYHESKKGD